jgi:peptide/nickel transport system permease protein
MALNQVEMTPPTLFTPRARPLEAVRPAQSFWGMAIATLRQDRLSLVALSFVLVMALLSLLAAPISQALVGVGPNQINEANKFAQPYLWPYLQWQMGQETTTAALMLGKARGVTHWLGTDQLGRDLLTRLLYGGRVSLTIALAAAAIAMLLGVSVGAVAGYFGGVVDDLVTWLLNTLISIPDLYLLIIVVTIFKPSALVLTLLLGFLGWFGTARFMRGNVFKLRGMDYALAARAVGSSDLRILVQHILPNTLPLIIVITAIDISGLILTESVLSFLGLGIQPPTASWGSMLDRANSFVFMQDVVTRHYIGLHLLIAPGLLITLTVLAFYLIGDGLRDALDPMLKNKK